MNAGFVVDGAVLAALISASVTVWKMVKGQKVTAEQIKLEILEAVQGVKDKISEQNGDIRVIKTEVVGFKTECKAHREKLEERDNGLDKRLELAEDRIFKSRRGG